MTPSQIFLLGISLALSFVVFVVVMYVLPMQTADNRSNANDGYISSPKRWYRAPGADTESEAVWYKEGGELTLRATSNGKPFVYQSWGGKASLQAEFRGKANDKDGKKQELGIQMSSGDAEVRSWALVDKQGKIKTVGWWSRADGELGRTTLDSEVDSIWLRLIRDGNTITSEYSLNGYAWSQVQNGRSTAIAFPVGNRALGFYTHGEPGGEAIISRFLFDVGSGFTLETYYDKNNNGTRDSGEEGVPSVLEWKTELSGTWRKYETSKDLDGRGGRVGGLSWNDGISVLLNVPEGYNAPTIEKTFVLGDADNQIIGFPLTKPQATVVPTATPMVKPTATPTLTPSKGAAPTPTYLDLDAEETSPTAVIRVRNSSPSPTPSPTPEAIVEPRSTGPLERFVAWLRGIWCAIFGGCA